MTKFGQESPLLAKQENNLFLTQQRFIDFSGIFLLDLLSYFLGDFNRLLFAPRLRTEAKSKLDTCVQFFK